MLTEEEKDELRLECANAKARCRETWATILHIKMILNSYQRSHSKWCERYQKADKKLAEEEKLRRVDGKKDVKVTLTTDQLRTIAEELGLEIEFDDNRQEHTS